MMYGVPNVEVVSWPPGLCEARACIPSADPAEARLGGHQWVAAQQGSACGPGDLNFSLSSEL